MKRGLFSHWSAGILAIALPLSGGSLPAQTAEAPDLSAGMTSDESALAEPAAPGEVNADDVANAPATVVSSQIAVPANLSLTPGATEVVRLANSGVDQSIMLSYVTNSSSTFNLDADDIIYLRDIGVPGEVVSAMIQHDQELQGQLAASAQAPAPPAPVEAPPITAVEPEPQTAPPVEAPLTPPVAAEPAASTFYGALSPYGTWVNVAGYGLCWQPTVGVGNPDWSPYWDGGHWVYTDLGWYWYSDYSWGWAPFHYGRWFRHTNFGWCWAPDRVWGPAWVSWRYNDDYCGWAPLGFGVSFSFGIGLSLGHHYWHDWDRPWNHHFVAWRDFRDHDLHHHGVGRHEVGRIFDRTVVQNRIATYNHVTINQGIPRDRVMAATHGDIRTVALHETRNVRSLGGRAERLDPVGRRLTVYRPPIAESDRGGRPNPGSGRRQPTAGNAAPGSGMRHSDAVAVSRDSRGASEFGALRVIGQRGTAPRTVGNRPGSPITRAQPAAPASSRFGANVPVYRQPPAPVSRADSPQTITRTSPGGVWSPARGAEQLSRHPSTRSSERTAPVTRYNPAPRQYSALTYPSQTRAPSSVQPRYNPAPQRYAAPSYQPPTRTAPLTRSYNPSRQYSAPSYAPQTRALSPVVPRSAAAPQRYTAPRFQAPARMAPEMPRYSQPRSYMPQRSYNSAPARSAFQAPGYSRAPAYTPQRSYSPPSYSPRSAPSQSPRFSASGSSGFSRGSGIGSGPGRSTPSAGPSRGSDQGGRQR